MRHLIALCLLAGCTMSDPVPVSGVVDLSMNGLVSLSLDGAAQRFDRAEPATTAPVQGRLSSTADVLTLASGATMRASSANSLTLDAYDGVSLNAIWNRADSFDIAAPARLESLILDTADLVDGGETRLTLGPQGGTLTLREIVPADGGGWRIRGSYSAQGCAQDSPGTCRMLTGTFAFTQSSLPTNGNIAALLPGG
jgi:hypothetical protein